MATDGPWPYPTVMAHQPTDLLTDAAETLTALATENQQLRTELHALRQRFAERDAALLRARGRA